MDIPEAFPADTAANLETGHPYRNIYAIAP
jgi:hypothetical protein